MALLILCYLDCSLQAHDRIYVACTSGLVTAISLEVTYDIFPVITLKEKMCMFFLFFLSFFILFPWELSAAKLVIESKIISNE